MCGGKKKKSKPPPAPPPPPPPQPPKQVAVQAAEQYVDKRRNMNRGAGPQNNILPAESMLTGMDGVDQEELQKRLGKVQLLGGTRGTTL